MQKETLASASRIIWIQVCVLLVLLNYLLKPYFPSGVTQSQAGKYNRIIDLEVDIGADAVDYKSVSLPFSRPYRHVN